MYQENNGFLEEVFDMRKILKIIVAPFVLVLILAVAVISFLSCIAGACCGLACAVFVLLAICGFFAGLETGCIACWCWRSSFLPLDFRPSGAGSWIACMG